jgi:hypothetical protein
MRQPQAYELLVRLTPPRTWNPVVSLPFIMKRVFILVFASDNLLLLARHCLQNFKKIDKNTSMQRQKMWEVQYKLLVLHGKRSSVVCRFKGD